MLAPVVPFIRAPLQPSELYQMAFNRPGQTLRNWERRALEKAHGNSDLKIPARVSVRHLDAQVNIDKQCRAFAKKLLAREAPRQLSLDEEQELVELRRIAGEVHSTVRWIEEVLLAQGRNT